MNDKIYIIAEAGVNHNGDLNTAFKLIDEAKNAGADAVKFQTFKAESIAGVSAKKAGYQEKLTGEGQSQLEMLKKLELRFEDFKKLKAYADKLGIDFLSTAFDIESAEFLHSLKLKCWKVPSGEITNLPLLEKIASYREKTLISTGMANMDEVKAAVSVFENLGSNDLILLHCTTEYPAPVSEVNLNAMLTIRRETGYRTGYSDHTEGIHIPIAAAALGAVAIEKHFTLDKNMPGPDHKASLEPEELKDMVKAIRDIELALGSGEKEPAEAELKNKIAVRKSIVALKKIRKGERFTTGNITAKRPGNGISPMKWHEVIGQESGYDFDEDELIRL